jgi:hypothetical protein
MDFPRLCNEFLLDALRRHGIAAELRGEWIVPDTRPSIPVQALAFRSEGSRASVVLFEVRALLPDARVLIETIAGFGEDDQRALEQAQEKFLTNAFHPLIEGLYGAHTPQQVTIEPWQVGEGSYRAYLGSYLLVGIRFEVPPELYDRIRAWVAAQPDDGLEFHWCRVFWGSTVAEVLWDNQSLPEAERELAALPWPELDGYASVRLFVLLRGPTQMDPRVLEIVDEAVRLFPQLDEDAYDEALERVATPREAQLATHFMQVAFGRALITRLFPVGPETFPDEFDWREGPDVVGHDRLSTNPYFRAAQRAVALADFATLQAIGSSAAEFNALNQALHGASERGIEPDDAWFAGIRFSPLSIPRPPSDA